MTINTTQEKKSKKSHVSVGNPDNLTIRNEVMSALLKQKQWSVTQLAKEAGMARAKVSRIYHFKQELALRDMLRIAQALDVDSRIIWPDRGDGWWEGLRKEALDEAMKKAQPGKDEPVVDEGFMEGYY